MPREEVCSFFQKLQLLGLTKKTRARYASLFTSDFCPLLEVFSFCLPVYSFMIFILQFIRGSKSMGVNCSILPFNATVLCHHLVMSFDFGIKKCSESLCLFK